MAIEIKVDAEAEAPKKMKAQLCLRWMLVALWTATLWFLTTSTLTLYMPQAKAVVTFAKMQSDAGRPRSHVDYWRTALWSESIRGGNVYGWNSGTRTCWRLDATKVIMMSIGKFSKKRALLHEKAYKEEETENLVEPDAEAPQSLAKFHRQPEKPSVSWEDTGTSNGSFDIYLCCYG